MAPTLPSIDPKTQRWEPTADPNDIVVPGLDSTAPVNDQIEQIEQLITIKLQNIDANFSKMQHIMANRILPAVKRYAVGTEPVREAARFWTTFFEQAAQIRVPTYDEYNSEQEQEEQEPSSVPDAGQGDASRSTYDASQVETTPTRSRHSFNSDETSSEVSFMPRTLISSTPATTSRQRSTYQDSSFTSQDLDKTPPWHASLESPLMRLDREIQSLNQDDEISITAYQSAKYDQSEDTTQRQIHPPPREEPQSPIDDKGKGKAMMPAKPLLHDVLRRNANYSDRSVLSPRKLGTSPLKVKTRTPISKKKNPYLPPGTKPDDWQGVVDLTDPSMLTPRKGYTPGPTPTSTLDLAAGPSAPKRPTTPTNDDSFDINFGMSPPITMDYARLPKLGKTPKKEAAERILQDIIDVEKRGVFRGARAAVGKTGTASGESSATSAMPTPPSLSRYHRESQGPEQSASVADSTLESMMRRVGLNMPESGETTSTTSTRTSSARSPPALASSASISRPFTRRPVPPPPNPPRAPESFEELQHKYNLRHVRDEDLEPPDLNDDNMDDSFNSEDSLDNEVHNTANPSAAFLLASERASYDDDDSSSDSFVADNADGDTTASMQPVHPFARGMPAGDDDGFDDDSFDEPHYTSTGEQEEETLFGVPPAQRLRMLQQRNAGVSMMGADLLQDTIGIGAQVGPEETPTPYPR
ncbi:hypothetical protein WOLCODRAFT_135554 [Wolfiporia cocos MD-104 SS10]|uniref:DASH complex subunit ASK1 n=1 Tax=Wolfiporia cocos (strain MD-104) TaxID=742152 RepID=A0A2H3IW45_WOLCO|nr:hypothetical protein WOLCODRAFT_135554 [Wolfiporia cocos MD-104 SS10]